MTCKSVQSQLDSFVDGELAASQMASIRRHFDQCVRCQQEFQTLLILKSELSQLDPPALDDGFEDRILAHVHAVAARQPQRIRRRFQLASIAAIAAAAVMLATVQSVASQRRLNEAANLKRFELDRDQAVVAAEDPLSGGAFMIPASYGK